MEEVKKLIQQAIEKNGFMYMYYNNNYIGLIHFGTLDLDTFDIVDNINGYLTLCTSGLRVNFDKVEID